MTRNGSNYTMLVIRGHSERSSTRVRSSTCIFLFTVVSINKDKRFVGSGITVKDCNTKTTPINCMNSPAKELLTKDNFPG